MSLDILMPLRVIRSGWEIMKQSTGAMGRSVRVVLFFTFKNISLLDVGLAAAIVFRSLSLVRLCDYILDGIFRRQALALILTYTLDVFDSSEGPPDTGRAA